MLLAYISFDISFCFYIISVQVHRQIYGGYGWEQYVLGGAGAPPRQPPRHAFGFCAREARLANDQGAALPFLPVTTPEEKDLFAQLIHDGHGSSARDPHCKSMALRWVHHVNGKLIFPKLPVQLRKHKKAWESSETIKRALKEAHRDREAVKRVLGEVQPEAVHVEGAYAMPGLTVPAAATDGLQYTVVANTAVSALRPGEGEEKARSSVYALPAEWCASGCMCEPKQSARRWAVLC